MVRPVIRTALLATLCLTLTASAGSAQDVRQNEAGKFDFYVLALSWSPSFCDAVGERAGQAGERASQQQQCGERPYAFVVHGLWPQYESGFPEYCQVPAPRLERAIVSSMLDLMPAPRLIFREWDRHGTCEGVPARAHFENVRKARAVVKIPSEYLDVKAELTSVVSWVTSATLTSGSLMSGVFNSGTLMSGILT